MKTMKKSTIAVIALGVIIFFTLAWGISTRNDLVEKAEEVRAEAAQVETQLQRRYDLIPNFVATVKGYAAHEEEVYTAIADARAKLGGAIKDEDVEGMYEANSELDDALSRLLVVVENYPELKANENFVALQDELAGTENRIAIARQNYNDKVKEYNELIIHFPENIIANMCGLEKADYFEASEEAKENPTVNFEE